MPARLFFALLGLIGATVLAPANASAAAVACGDVVTQSVRLTAPLTGCSTGLVVGADSITIDLNGFTISGDGAPGGVGIDAEGRSRVVIRSGGVRGFDRGVRLFNASASMVTGLQIRDTTTGVLLVSNGAPSGPNVVTGNAIISSVDGVVSFGSFDRIVGNAISGASGRGIRCRDGGASRIANNLVTGSGVGIELFFCVGDLVENATIGNVGDGIARIRASGLVERNVSSQNGGNGINSDDSHGVFLRNATIANQMNGLTITDSSPDHGPFHTITGHVSLANRGHGIFTNLTGVIDGGGNLVRANGTSPQCFGFACS
jgi:Right handed beta helix region